MNVRSFLLCSLIASYSCNFIGVANEPISIGGHVSNFLKNNLVSPLGKLSKRIYFLTYCLRFNNGIGLPYYDFLKADQISYTTREAARRAGVGYPKGCGFSQEVLKKIRIIRAKEEHIFGTPAEVIHNLVVLYPTFFLFSLEEQTGILAHEFSHILYHHFIKRLGMVGAVGGVAGLGSYYVDKAWPEDYQAQLIYSWGINILALMGELFLCNQQERSADIHAAQALGTSKGLISVFQKWRARFIKDQLSTSSKMQDFFGFHPSLDTRILYLTDLENQMNSSCN